MIWQSSAQEEAERLPTGQLLEDLLEIGTEVMERARESETGEPHSYVEDR